MTNKDLINNTSSQDSFLIVGFGMTGKAIARFLDNKNLFYYIVDNRDITEEAGTGFKKQLSEKSAQELLASSQITSVFPSPGVSLQHSVVTTAAKHKVPIIGELELASFYLQGDFIAVTGTNGKSTTAMLINALLEDAGMANRLCGNIGEPLINAVNEPPTPFYVIEESSYQLELVGSLKHRIAICLNVTEDHFDRYDNIQDYALAKQNIIKNSDKNHWFIFNDDDPYCQRMSWESNTQNSPYSLVKTYNQGSYSQHDELIVKLNNETFTFKLSECALTGLHNHENMLASLTAVLLINKTPEAVNSYKKTLKTFKGLKHRMQKVHEFNGVHYYDDSKATNVGAVVMALASFDQPIILIAGGKEKNCDFAPLKGIIKNKVKKLILLGDAKDKMETIFKNDAEIILVKDMKEAVLQAKQEASEGDVVLLSPACASFDQYKNFEERGYDFQQHVKDL
jgi:UDP-N-acetylmuramoylalanine--D-glutamate ligase